MSKVKVIAPEEPVDILDTTGPSTVPYLNIPLNYKRKHINPVFICDDIHQIQQESLSHLI